MHLARKYLPSPSTGEGLGGGEEQCGQRIALRERGRTTYPCQPERGPW
jgi:hypothetical protein